MEEQKFPKISLYQRLRAKILEFYFTVLDKIRREPSASESWPANLDGTATLDAKEALWQKIPRQVLEKLISWLGQFDLLAAILASDNLPDVLKQMRLLMVVFAAYVSADLLTQTVAINTFGTSEYVLPRATRTLMHPLLPKPVGAYKTIVSQNYFCPDCSQEGKSRKAKEEPKDCRKVALARANIEVVGAIVMNLAKLSLVTVRLSTRKEASFKIGETIPQVGQVVEIIRNGFCYKNASGDWERVENESKKGINLIVSGANAPKDLFNKVPPSDRFVKNDGMGNFTIDKKYKEDVLKNNLNEILQQAKAIPEYDVATGEVRCWKMTQVIADSLFEKLGVQNGDCIVSVNGQNLSSQGKALEIFTQMKNVSAVSIEYERNGAPISSKYDFK